LLGKGEEVVQDRNILTKEVKTERELAAFRRFKGGQAKRGFDQE